MKKLNKKQIEKLKIYWQNAQREHHNFYIRLNKLEEAMSKEFKIKDLIFFFCDGDMCGIGNESRTISLIHRAELEKE